MTKRNQQTIFTPVSCYGVGVHSGRKTQLTLRPALEDVGIIFIRTDVKDLDNHIEATYRKVTETTMSTTISNDARVSVSTIEHLMAALWGCGIDNVFVEVDGPEVPIMDGSSKPFVFMIECAGHAVLDKKKKQLQLLKEISVIDRESEIFASPTEYNKIDLTIDFSSPAIGRQHLILSNDEEFRREVADSRTFGFVDDLDYLLSRGLAKGASLDNTIGIDQDRIMNHDGLRHKDEFVRHKMLDLVGDLFCAGSDIQADIKANKSSHNINNVFLRKIFEDPYSYKWE